MIARRSVSRTTVTLLVAMTACRAPDTTHGDLESVRSEIERVVASSVPTTVPAGRRHEHLRSELAEFYRRRDHFPAWHEATELSPAGRAALQTLARADEHGLQPDDYLGLLPPERDGGDARTKRHERAARRDVALSVATMRYIQDIHEGRFSPVELGLDLAVTHHHPKPTKELAAVAASDRVSERLEAFAPPYPDYRRLQRALGTYRELARRERWQPLPDGSTIHPGETYEHLDRLRDRLRHTTDLPPSADSAGPRYDPALVAAVTRFQGRHGLNADGVVGEQTFAALNTPWTRRVDQIIASMERWRWVSGHFDGKAIIVNIPEFTLRGIVADGPKRRTAFASRVIVGRHYRDLRTPIFTGELRYIDFQPYWNVPASIVRNELSEHLVEPRYLERHGYEIVRDSRLEAEPLPPTPSNINKVRDGALRLRQRPGRKNALGLVKFIFPNRYSVFLHGTPETHLFEREERAFSHGCVRVADAVGLAEWILAGQPGWDRETIAAALAKDATTRAFVEGVVPVYLLYLTAYVDDASGAVHFSRDIYDLDAALLAAIDAG